MCEDVLVLVEKAREGDAVEGVEGLGPAFEGVPLWAVADDAEGVVGVDAVEGVQQAVDVLVRDEPAGEQDIETDLGRRDGSDAVDVDAVGDHLDGLAGGAERREAVGGDSRDGDGVLGDAGGEVLDGLAEGGEAAEVALPVVPPDLVPGGDEGVFLGV